MADSKIQIAVEVVGADKANKQIQSLETSSVDLKEGVKGVGDGFKSVGDLVKAQGGLMGDALGTLGDSVIAITDSVFVFKEGMAVAGATGAKAWLGLLGPIAAVVGAIALAVDAYKQLSGATREAEMWEEAMSATASDLTSRMEALAETGLKPTITELKTFIALNQQARFSLELLGLKNETLVKQYKAQKDALDKLNKAKDTLALMEEKNDKLGKVTNLSISEQIRLFPTLVKQLWSLDEATDNLTEGKKEYDIATQKVKDSEIELARVYEKEVIPQLQKALKVQELASKSQVQFEDDLLAKLKEVEGYQLSRLDSQRKNKEAIELIGTATKKYTESVIRRKEKERDLQDQLKRNIITQEQYDLSLMKLKSDVQDEIKALDDRIAKEKKLADQESENADKRSRLEELSSRAFEIRQKQYDREVELINREKQEIIDLATERSQIFNANLRIHMENSAKYKVREFEMLQEMEIVDKLSQKYNVFYTVKDLLNKNYGDLSESSKDFLNLLRVMNKDFEQDVSGKNQIFIGSTEQHLELSEKMVTHTLEKIAEDLTKADLNILKAQKEYQLKNRKQLKLSQKQIEEDYEYHSKRTVDLAKKEARDRFLVSLEGQIGLSEKVRENNLAYGLMLREFYLSEVESDKKLAVIRYNNLDATEKSRLDLLNQINKLEIEYYNRKIKKDKIDVEERLKVLTDNFDMEKSLYKELYSVEGMLTTEGTNKILETTRNFELERKTLTEQANILEKEKLILHEEILQKQNSINLENYLYEKKYGEDRLSLLETLFLTEDQIRERAKEHIYGTSSEKIKIEIDETKKLRSELEKRLADEQELLESHKRLASDTMEELARQLSFEPKNEAESRERELRIKALKDEQDLEIQIYTAKKEEIKKIQEEGNAERENLLKKETELTKKYKAKQVEQEFKTFNTVGQMLKDFGDSSTQALISSGVAAAFAGENIANALKQTLRGLAQEATAKSLLEGAYALGALAMGDEKGASMHGLAALKFGMAAIAVGAMSTLGGAPATGGGASTSTSPTATPQATATEARPEARETQPIVYNINFGGSVIYDTREAAMRAFSNEITQIQSRAVRGTQSARMMNRG